MIRCSHMAGRGVIVFLGLYGAIGAASPGVPSRDGKSRGLLDDSLTVCASEHDIGKLSMGVSGQGKIGIPPYGPHFDCISGEVVSTYSQYPRQTGTVVIYGGGLWVGAQLGSEVCVSTSHSDDGRAETFPSDLDRQIIERSMSRSDQGARSEQDLIVVYTDTVTSGPFAPDPDYFGARPHRPLGLKVTQASYAWSFDYAEDFVLFDMIIENIGDEVWENAYIGLFWDFDIYFKENEDELRLEHDDLCGYRVAFPSALGCSFEDTFNLAWEIDNDGDPIDGEFSSSLVPGVGKSANIIIGCFLLTDRTEFADLSFNWYLPKQSDTPADIGPRTRDLPGRPFWDFRTGGLGNPIGDRNKYYLLHNNEIDYDQAYTSTISPTDSIWLAPEPGLGKDLADGQDSRFLLSFGPFEFQPGDQMPLAFAVVAGEGVHTDPNNLVYLPELPYLYYEHLDFSDLAKNALWAKWVYDNPGVDTDGDGYFGKIRVCVLDSVQIDGEWVPTVADTSFYEGDGVPDWRAGTPPPAPDFWIYPTLNGLRVRFNGYRSETTEDAFSQLIDFEGYRVYIARDDRGISYSLATSYDRENYDKYLYTPSLYPSGGFEVNDIPFSIDQLRCLYGSGSDPCNDLTFHPLDYGRDNLYHMPGHLDSVFYFTKHDYNVSDFGVSTEIRKIYPAAPKPQPGDTLNAEYLTEDGYLKYYEYECLIDGLLPSVPYWVNVTAFDFGSASSGLPPLETSKTRGAKSAYPASDVSQLSGEKTPVYVYPNPYRINGHYRRDGYEGRGVDDRPDRRLRLLHFENLPAKCTIEIHSLDGDLLRRIHHDVDPSDPNHTHDTWNLITRNGQAPVSGLYYWVVEDENGNTEMGKFVLMF